MPDTSSYSPQGHTGRGELGCELRTTDAKSLHSDEQPVGGRGRI